jgi:hypothetical protein
MILVLIIALYSSKAPLVTFLGFWPFILFFLLIALPMVVSYPIYLSTHRHENFIIAMIAVALFLLGLILNLITFPQIEGFKEIRGIRFLICVDLFFRILALSDGVYFTWMRSFILQDGTVPSYVQIYSLTGPFLLFYSFNQFKMNLKPWLVPAFFLFLILLEGSRTKFIISVLCLGVLNFHYLYSIRERLKFSFIVTFFSVVTSFILSLISKFLLLIRFFLKTEADIERGAFAFLDAIYYATSNIFNNDISLARISGAQFNDRLASGHEIMIEILDKYADIHISTAIIMQDFFRIIPSIIWAPQNKVSSIGNLLGDLLSVGNDPSLTYIGLLLLYFSEYGILIYIFICLLYWHFSTYYFKKNGLIFIPFLIFMMPFTGNQFSGYLATVRNLIFFIFIIYFINFIFFKKTKKNGQLSK